MTKNIKLVQAAASLACTGMRRSSSALRDGGFSSAVWDGGVLITVLLGLIGWVLPPSRMPAAGTSAPEPGIDLAVGTAELLYFRLIRRSRGLPRLIRWPPTHSARCGSNLDPRTPRTGGGGTGPWSQCWPVGRWWKRC